MLETLDCPAERCVFIDDRRVNCDAALSAGMHAIHFTGSVDALRRELTRLTLL